MINELPTYSVFDIYNVFAFDQFEIKRESLKSCMFAILKIHIFIDLGQYAFIISHFSSCKHIFVMFLSEHTKKLDVQICKDMTVFNNDYCNHARFFVQIQSCSSDN